jgi:ATP-binding cassette subfamily B protein
MGTIAEFIIYVNMLTWPVTSIGWVTSIIQTAAASQKRINNFLSEDSESSNLLNKAIFSGSIKFKNVFHSYQKDTVYLKNININILDRNSLGIIGSIGSGKSTIVKLVCQFLDPSKGMIYVDDQPINILNIKTLRSIISYVPQDDFLFSDTIKNNLLFGNINANDDDINNVLIDVRMHDEVLRFKDGINTYVGERGLTLSGGQKQRLSIARAMLKKSKILLLDDCLSSVDVDTEKKILSTVFSKYKKDMTIILVSNRVHSIMHCDNIIVLENGEIIEEGRHLDLLKMRGFYHKLNLIQMQNFNKKA